MLIVFKYVQPPGGLNRDVPDPEPEWVKLPGVVPDDGALATLDSGAYAVYTPTKTTVKETGLPKSFSFDRIVDVEVAPVQANVKARKT